MRATDYVFALATLGDVTQIEIILSNQGFIPISFNYSLFTLAKFFLLKPPMRATDYRFALATLGDVIPIEMILSN
jgi:hypothetical protein